MKQDTPNKHSLKRAGVTMLVSNKVNFKARKVTGDEEASCTRTGQKGQFPRKT